GEEGVDGRSQWIATDRPLVIEQYADHPMSGGDQEDGLGPNRNLPVPRIGSLAEGTVKTGPTPQMSSPGCVGERNNDWVMSPTPLVLLSKNGLGWLSNGMMVREIRFQSSLRCIGTTG